MKKLFIIFAILCLAAPAMAADWNFYGSARMATWRTANDVGYDGAEADDDDTLWGQQGNSRIGAKVKLNDQIGGAFEMSDSFGKRKLYGTYTFGNGAELLLGQTYTPTSDYFYSNSVYGTDGDLLGVGQFYVGRVPMIRFKMGGLKIALVEPSTSANFYDEGLDDIVAYADDVDVDLPKLEVSYKFKTDTFFVDVFGGYQTFTLDDDTYDEDIDSYVIGVGGGANFGAFYFNLGVHMGQNLGNYGASGFLLPANVDLGADEEDLLGAGAGAGFDADGDIVDNDGLGYLAVVGFNASEMITIEAGYGFQSYEWDVNNSEDINATQYYLNATINIAPGFFIVPEIGKVEYELFDEDFGDFIYYGAKWQINF